MLWLCNDKELKTKQGYIDLYSEILAYCKLEGQPFDFGTRLIENNLSYGAEEID